MATAEEPSLPASPKFRGARTFAFVGLVVAWSIVAAMLGAKAANSQMQVQLEQASRGIAELREEVMRQKTERTAGGAPEAAKPALPGATAAAAEPAVPEAPAHAQLRGPMTLAQAAPPRAVKPAVPRGGAHALPGDAARKLAIANLAQSWEATAGTGCIVFDYGTTFDLSMNGCNMNRCPPCFAFNYTSTYTPTAPEELKLERCSTMKLSNDVSLGQSYFANAAQRIDIFNLSPMAFFLTDGRNKWGIPGYTSTYAMCYADSSDYLTMSGEGNYRVARSAHKRLSIAGGVWHEKTSWANWDARSDFQAVEVHGYTYLYGGIGSMTTQFGDIWVSSDGGAYWTTACSAYCFMGNRYGYALLTLADGTLALLGGRADGTTCTGGWCQDMWLSDDGDTWSQASSSLSVNTRDKWHATSVGMKIYVCAGIDSSAGTSGMETYRADCWVGDDSGSFSSATTNAEFGQRYKHGLVARSDGALLIMGGKDSNNNILSDVWISTSVDYNGHVDASTWRNLTMAAPWSPRYDFGALVRGDGRILIIGGITVGNNHADDVWCSSEGHEWSLLAPTLGAVDAGGGFATVLRGDGSIMLLGGYQTPNGPAGQAQKEKKVFLSGELGWNSF